MDGFEAAHEAQGSPILPKLGIRFVVAYAVLTAVLFSIYGFPFELFGARQDWLSGYLEGYAHVAGGVLHWLDPSISVNGNRIDGRFSLQIVRNCDAIEINILFASAILAFPAPFVRRLLALICGLAILVSANVARICVLYFIGVHFPRWFAPAHEELLPLVLIVLTALLFLVCTGLLRANRIQAVTDSAPPIAP
jgi:exosortase/archaeosortase family protein